MAEISPQPVLSEITLGKLETALIVARAILTLPFSWVRDELAYRRIMGDRDGQC